MPDGAASIARQIKEQTARRSWAPMAVAFAAIAGLQAYLVFAKSINWDEFFFFSRIQQLQDGSLTQPLQTFYTRLFVWLKALPVDSVDQLLAGRIVMLGCEFVAAGAIFAIARRFASARTAVLCALTYLSAGYVFLHGFAFRADPLATALLMSAVALLLRRTVDWRTAATVSVFTGLAAIITIKTVFYAPVFIAAAWLKLREERFSRSIFLRLAAIGAGAAATFAGLYLWHSSGLSASPANGGGAAASAWHTVFSAGLFPQGPFLERQLLLAPFASLLLIAAPFLWRRRFSIDERIALAGFTLPLLTLVFYRNSYPYFFAFVLAPAMIGAIPAVEVAARRLGDRLYVAVLVANALFLTLSEPRQVLPAQREIVDGVHQIFPRPVAYFGFCGMIGDFHRPLNILTSGWGLQSYRKGEMPTLTALMNEQPVPLLILNHRVFTDAMSGKSGGESFLPADAEALRENYIPHWGPVWVAGKKLPRGTGPLTINVAVPGTYTVEEAAVSIDGKMLAAGNLVRLARGKHIVFPSAAHDAVLRWGDHLVRPASPAPQGYPFTEY